MPAHAWTIAAFLRWMDSQNNGDQVHAALKSISRAHLLCGRRSPHHHPMIERTLSSIERRRETSQDRSNLFEAHDFLTTPMIGSSDRNIDPEEIIDTDLLHEGDEAAPPPPTSNRLSMRSQPRLVSRRRYSAS